jgi:hypothetical protein
MSPNRNHRTTRFRRLACIAMLALAPCVARAQDSAPVYVRFEFSDAGLARMSPVGQERVIADTLAAVLGRKFDFWPFVADTANGLPRLEFRIEAHDASYDLLVAIRATDGTRLDAERAFPLLPQGEAERVSGTTPSPRRLPRKVGTALAEWLDGDGGGVMLGTLELRAPIAVLIARAQPPDERALLPLRWDRYAKLGSSRFIIFCDWPLHGTVQLHSTGAGFHRDYPSTNPFEALVVDHDGWGPKDHLEKMKDHMQALGELKPRAVMLEEFVSIPGSDSFNVAPPRP